MIFHLAILIPWLLFLCGALGDTIVPSLPVGAVLLESASQLRPVYDYVVVGGGTSGLVVANRLTEDPKSMSRAHQMCGGQTVVDPMLCSQSACHRVRLRVCGISEGR